MNLFELKINDIQITRGSCPSIHYRKAGDAEWIYEQCSDLTSDGRTVQAAFSRFTLVLQTDTDEDAVMIHAQLHNHADEAYEIARVQYFDAPLNHLYSLLPPTGCRPMKKRVVRLGDELPDFWQTTVTNWSNANVYWERMKDPVYCTPNCCPCEDLAILVSENGGSDITIGFVGPGKSFGEICFFTQEGGSLMVGPMLEGILLRPGAARQLESAAIIAGDWQHARRKWAALCKKYMEGGDLKKREKSIRLTGYCSWYQHYCMITGEQFEQAAEEFSGWADSLPVLVQLDDGFQRGGGDWDPNERFKAIWQGLPKRMKEKNLIPGLWLAPLTVTEGTEAYEKLSHCIQRNAAGDPCVRFSNWNWAIDGERKYPEGTAFLDPALPEVKEWIADLIRKVVADGWEYLKLDFLYGISNDRVRERNETYFETLRNLFAVMREAAGDDVWISSCTGCLSRFAMGYADSARSGGDSGEELALARANMWDYFLGLCTREWWQCDPDVYFMRSERIQLTPVERRVMTATIGETGGCFQTSDLPSQCNEEDKAFVRQYWNGTVEDTKAQSYMILRDYEIAAVAVKRTEYESLLVYNWEDTARDVCITAEELVRAGCRLRGVYSADGKRLSDSDGIVIKDMPAHSVAVAR